MSSCCTNGHTSGPLCTTQQTPAPQQLQAQHSHPWHQQINNPSRSQSVLRSLTTNIGHRNKSVKEQCSYQKRCLLTFQSGGCENLPCMPRSAVQRRVKANPNISTTNNHVVSWVINSTGGKILSSCCTNGHTNGPLCTTQQTPAPQQLQAQHSHPWHQQINNPSRSQSVLRSLTTNIGHRNKSVKEQCSYQKRCLLTFQSGGCENLPCMPRSAVQRRVKANPNIHYKQTVHWPQRQVQYHTIHHLHPTNSTNQGSPHCLACWQSGSHGFMGNQFNWR